MGNTVLAAVAKLDGIVATTLGHFGADVLGCAWAGKEHDWVNRYAHGYLLKYCDPVGPLRDASQIAIEVGVPQPPGYTAGAVRRDLVIWPEPGMSCWTCDWQAVHHPLCIMEWKVHRSGHRNRDVDHEREWLRHYTAWQPDTIGYAVEVDLTRMPHVLRCSRFVTGSEELDWRRFLVSPIA